METKPTYETKAPTVVQPLTPAVWEMLMAIGTATTDSRKFGLFKPEEAAIKMLVAYEHGIPLTSALSTVYVIDNKPVLAPVLMWAKILNHPDFGGYEEKRLEKSGAFFGWEITLKRKSGHQAMRCFTLEDAQRAGLASKNNWQTYPEDVCYWRTMERAAKVVFADVTQGLYTADELGADISPEGDVIDSEWTVSVPKTDKEPTDDQQGDDNFDTVDALLAQWTPEVIMEANDGKIPATSEECRVVAEKLSEEATNE